MRTKAIVGKINQPLDVVARQYAEAVKILGSDLVIEAARGYTKRHPDKLPLKTVSDLVTEFLAEKRKQGRSDRHLETLKSHCKRVRGHEYFEPVSGIEPDHDRGCAAFAA